MSLPVSLLLTVLTAVTAPPPGSASVSGGVVHSPGTPALLPDPSVRHDERDVAYEDEEEEGDDGRWSRRADGGPAAPHLPFTWPSRRPEAVALSPRGSGLSLLLRLHVRLNC
jgi:hypothetical protein